MLILAQWGVPIKSYDAHRCASAIFIGLSFGVTEHSQMRLDQLTLLSNNVNQLIGMWGISQPSRAHIVWSGS